MPVKPLSREEAETRCKAYEHLAGKRFLQDGTYESIVECVTIAPYDPINKLILLYEYKDYRDCNQAMEFYAGYDYDVVVISKVKKDKDWYTYQNLEEFLTTVNAAEEPVL